jgi:hypothetical protein
VGVLSGCAAGPIGDEEGLYRSEWSLKRIASDRKSITISVIESCSGHDRFDHAEFSDADRGMVVTIFSRRPNGACTAEADPTRYDIDLPRALGNDEIVPGCWRVDRPPGCYPEKKR